MLDNCVTLFSRQDIRSEVLVGEDRGFKLLFTFKADNPHFANKVRGPGANGQGSKWSGPCAVC